MVAWAWLGLARQAIKLWNGVVPTHLEAAEAAKYLFGAENFGHFAKCVVVVVVVVVIVVVVLVVVVVSCGVAVAVSIQVNGSQSGECMRGRWRQVDSHQSVV